MIIKRLSIITVVRNDVEGLKKTIDSVTSQRAYFKAEIEYIIVDGNSSDGTSQLISAKKSQIEKWVSENDNGIYDAMNKGVQMATGDALLFMNAGDYFVGNVLGELVSAPAFLPVKYIDIFGRLRNRAILNIRRGICNNHQGIVFEQKGLRYNLNYKIYSDYQYFIDHGYDSKVKILSCPGYVFFDASDGISSQQILRRDVEGFLIQLKNFGLLSAIIWSTPSALKILIRALITKLPMRTARLK